MRDKIGKDSEFSKGLSFGVGRRGRVLLSLNTYLAVLVMMVTAYATRRLEVVTSNY